jgi:toxin ParE1/3/4
MSRLREAVGLLSAQPLSAPRVDEEDVRVLFVGRNPYKVFYRVRADSVEILHIRHTARFPGEFERG